MDLFVFYGNKTRFGTIFVLPLLENYTPKAPKFANTCLIDTPFLMNGASAFAAFALM